VGREETVEQDGINNYDAEKEQIGPGSRHELRIPQNRRHAEANDPGVETHADPPERLGVDLTNEPGAERHADEQARHDRRRQG